MSGRRTSVHPTAIVPSARALKAMRRNAVHAYVPQGKPRKNAKPLDSGAKFEASLDRVVYRSGVTCWRLPGVKGTRLCGTGMRPDGAGYLPELAQQGLVSDHIPQVRGRSRYNFLISYKGQRGGGSAKQKLDKEIVDLGHWSDMDRIVAVLVLDMDVLTPSEVAHVKGLGKRHAVVVLTDNEVKAGLLAPSLIAVAERRARLYRRVGPRGGYRPTARFDRVEQGFVERQAARRDIRSALSVCA